MTRLRIRQLVIAAESLEAADQLQAALELGEPFADPGVAEFGLENAVFALGDQFIEVVAPTTSDAPVQRFLKKNGPGGYMAIFQTDDLKAARARVDGAGIRRVWNADLDDISASHLHPADVGGAIVSIDEARPWESWRWGGPDWQKTAVPGELIGAVIEGTDPGQLASRWAAALGRPASTGPDETRIDLDQGHRLIFQHSGEQAKLEAFCVNVDNAMDALERADRLGLETFGDALMIAGVRLILNNRS